MQALGGDLAALVARDLAPAARSRLVAEAARRDIGLIETAGRSGAPDAPRAKVLVDGREGAPFESVNPDRGTIVVRLGQVGEVLALIHALLVQHSPRLTGAYAASHKLFADGVEVDPANPPAAGSYLFVSTSPYARRIERGESSQAPEGVYESVAVLAGRQFGNVAAIEFGFDATVTATPAPDRGGRKRAREAERASRAPSIFVKAR